MQEYQPELSVLIFKEIKNKRWVYLLVNETGSASLKISISLHISGSNKNKLCYHVVEKLRTCEINCILIHH
jgi:uncharacterized membrane protein YhfC